MFSPAASTVCFSQGLWQRDVEQHSHSPSPPPIQSTHTHTHTHTVRRARVHTSLRGLEMTRLAEFEVYLRGYDYYSPLHTHAHTNHTLFSGEPQWSWGLIQYEGCSRWLCSVQFKVASGQFDPDLCLLSAPLIVLPATHTHTHAHIRALFTPRAHETGSTVFDGFVRDTNSTGGLLYTVCTSLHNCVHDIQNCCKNLFHLVE